MQSSINIKKISIGGNMRDIVPFDTYINNTQAYLPASTAIDYGGYALPIITQTAYEMGDVGILPQPNSVISKVNMPTSSSEKYSIEGNENVVDFSDVSNYHEIIEKQKRVMELENELLTNSDNVTVLKISEKDTPAMVGLKGGINLKNCDIKSYENRFDGNYPNDVRILGEESITLPKLTKFGNALDMKITLTFQDKSPDVPNPMGEVISVELTGGDN